MAHLGVFGTTLVAFFLAEMGDKTQIATIALAAKYQAFYYVVAGTTLGSGVFEHAFDRPGAQTVTALGADGAWSQVALRVLR